MSLTTGSFSMASAAGRFTDGAVREHVDHALGERARLFWYVLRPGAELEVVVGHLLDALDAGEHTFGVVVDFAGGLGDEGVVGFVVERVEQAVEVLEVVEAGQPQQPLVERVPVGVGAVVADRSWASNHASQAEQVRANAVERLGPRSVGALDQALLVELDDALRLHLVL